MYFANLYVSLLDQISDGVEASLDVFGLFVKSGFLHQGNCSSIVTKDFHWTRCMMSLEAMSVFPQIGRDDAAQRR